MNHTVLAEKSIEVFKKYAWDVRKLRAEQSDRSEVLVPNSEEFHEYS